MSSIVSDNLQLLGEALYSAEVDQCYYYPGMQGHVLADAIMPGVKPSLNERNAFEFGYGSSIAGGRTVVVFKGVGLATCLDSVHHAVINGVGAGLVVILLEDTVAASSPEIIDSRVMLDYARTLLIEPGSIESALKQLGTSFEVSEQLDTPVFFRMTYELLSSVAPEAVAPSTPASKIPEIAFDAYRQKSIGAWAERVIGYDAKQAAIQAYVDAIYEPLIPSETVDVAFGAADGDSRIEHYPVATGMRDYYAQKKPNVHEIGSNYGLRSLSTAASISLDSSNILAPTMPVMRDWENALSRIDKSQYKIVIADEGRYTSDSTGLVDLCLCMGSSIAICAGASKQTGTRNLAIIGDFAYLFNAYPSIMEAAAHGVDMDIVLLDDGKASSTGSQDSIMPVRISDVAAYVSEIVEYNYAALPDELMKYDIPGIHIYKVKK